MLKTGTNQTLQELSQKVDSPRKYKPKHRKVPSKGFALVGAVLQQPADFFIGIKAGRNLPHKIAILFVSSTLFLFLYGAVLGSGNLYLSIGTAIAIPFIFLGSLATCIPVMYLLDVLTGSQRTLGQLVAVIFTSINVAATVFFSFVPIIVVFKFTGTIPQFLWINIGVLALATLVGLIYVTQGLIQTAMVDTGHALWRVNKRLHFIWMLLFLMVMGQMAWGMLSFFQTTGGFAAFLP